MVTANAPLRLELLWECQKEIPADSMGCVIVIPVSLEGARVLCGTVGSDDKISVEGNGPELTFHKKTKRAVMVWVKVVRWVDDNGPGSIEQTWQVVF